MAYRKVLENADLEMIVRALETDRFVSGRRLIEAVEEALARPTEEEAEDRKYETQKELDTMDEALDEWKYDLGREKEDHEETKQALHEVEEELYEARVKIRQLEADVEELQRKLGA